MIRKTIKETVWSIWDEEERRKHALITDISHGCQGCPEDDALSVPLETQIKWIEFGYDPVNKSLDIYFRKHKLEWNNGVAIQVNKLTDKDKEALKQYLESGK